MNMLSIDTTKSSYSLSVIKNDNISTYIDKSDVASSETILSEINNLVIKNNIKPSDINSVIYNNGQNFNVKDYAHMHDPKIPGSNRFVVFIKKLYPRFRGTLKFFVFKINEGLLKKFFK